MRACKGRRGDCSRYNRTNGCCSPRQLLQSPQRQSPAQRARRSKALGKPRNQTVEESVAEISEAVDTITEEPKEEPKVVPKVERSGTDLGINYFCRTG